MNNSVITFDVGEDGSLQSITEDFERMPLAVTQSDKGVKGVYSKWDFTKCGVAEPDPGYCNGARAVGMVKPSQVMTSAPLTIAPYMVQFTVYNPTATDANFKLAYSIDRGVNWQTAAESVVTVEAGTSKSVSAQLPTDAPVMLRINQTSGNSKAKCYLDDIKLFYTDTWPEPAPLPGDVDGDGEVSISDVNAVIDLILGGEGNEELRSRADVNEDGEIGISDVNMIINMIFQ